MRGASSGRVPSLATRVLALCLPRRDRRFALADLAEEFEERAASTGVRQARRWYRMQLARTVAPALVGRMRRRLHSSDYTRAKRGSPGGGWVMGVQNFMGDLTYAIRTLVKAPATLLITVLSLGLGIGAVTTVFAVADGLLYPPAVGLRAPERLVTVYTSEEDGQRYGTSSFLDYQSLLGADAVEDAAALTLQVVSLDEAGTPEPAVAEVVTGNYFDVTGIRPALGRGFLPDEGAVGAGAPVVVIGHDLWSERFGADPGIIGRSVRLNGHPHTIVGVAPAGVVSRRVPVRPDLWVPLGSAEGGGVVEGLADRGSRAYLVVARLSEDSDVGQLQAQLAVLGDRLNGEYPEFWTDDRGDPRVFSAVSERESRLNPGGRAVLGGIAVFFLGATGLILLIACANVTSLFLVRATKRRREIAVRLALGADRPRIVSMLLAEGLIPGLVAGLVGLWFAGFLAGAMQSVSLPINIPIRLDFHPDGRALAFAFLTALGASLVFSLVPALSVSRPELVPALRGEGGGSPNRVRGIALRNVLVVVQFAASLVLLVGAGLFLRSLQGAANMDLGLDPAGVAVMSKQVPEDLGPAGQVEFYRELVARLSAIPAVSGAAVSRGLEMTLLQFGTQVAIETGARDQPEGGVGAYRNAVTPGYMEMLDIAVLRGRAIQDQDAPGAAQVAVVNEAFARTFWPGEDPLGRQFTMIDRTPRHAGEEDRRMALQVVGLAADGTYLDIGDPPTPYLWTSLYQDPVETIAITLEGASGEAMVQELRARIDLAPGEVPIIPPSTYESQVSLQLMHLRLASKVLGWGGGFGLFLALIGIYGLVSFTVAQRTREMAIRLAIGADRGQVVGSLVRHGLGLAVSGLTVGLLVVLPTARLLRSVLVGVGPTDPLSLGGGVALLLAAAAIASFIPARRVTRIDPMVTLREE